MAVTQLAVGQKPSGIYLSVKGLTHLLAGLMDAALIRCDCMIMKWRDVMSEPLTQTSEAAGIPNHLRLSGGGGHLGSHPPPTDRLALPLVNLKGRSPDS